MSHKGFGIVGLLIVIAIIGVIAGGSLYSVKRAENDTPSINNEEEAKRAIEQAEGVKSLIEERNTTLEKKFVDMIEE